MKALKWLEEKDQRIQGKKEKKFLKKMGIKPTPNSGARWHSKSDGVLGRWRVELKTTDKKQNET